MSSPYLSVFRSRRLAVILALGFSSGLPIALTGGTLQAWMTVEGVDLSTIGAFTLVGLPYVWKFLWAPAMDRFVPPFLGRRRGWLLVTQLALALGIAAMAFLSPRSDLALVAWLALAVAFLSASQDIVVDAYRTDVVSREERGLAGALGVVGYRIAMLVSGALALVLVAGSGFIPALGWRDTYLLMAALMAVGMLAAFLGEEPASVQTPRTLREAVVEPFHEFFSRPGAIAILALLILYKFGDAFAGSLTTAFLLRGAGFSLDDVGFVNKAVGLAATIAGALFGGALMVKMGLYRALLSFGILQGVAILSFMWLALVGKNYPIMVLAVGLENVTSGMGTAAFVALLMALCDHRFTATQYALLSALAAIGRVFIGPVAGYATDPRYLGLSWAAFFFWAFVSAIPGLVLVWMLRGEIEAAEARQS
ncbi:MAG TPA: MFS transporter [Burkholderiales bacterium]|nr:MFS transporter [Burkholderiales bacterium]